MKQAQIVWMVSWMLLMVGNAHGSTGKAVAVPKTASARKSASKRTALLDVPDEITGLPNVDVRNIKDPSSGKQVAIYSQIIDGNRTEWIADPVTKKPTYSKTTLQDGIVVEKHMDSVTGKNTSGRITHTDGRQFELQFDATGKQIGQRPVEVKTIISEGIDLSSLADKPVELSTLADEPIDSVTFNKPVQSGNGWATSRAYKIAKQGAKVMSKTASDVARVANDKMNNVLVMSNKKLGTQFKVNEDNTSVQQRLQVQRMGKQINSLDARIQEKTSQIESARNQLASMTNTTDYWFKKYTKDTQDLKAEITVLNRQKDVLTTQQKKLLSDYNLDAFGNVKKPIQQPITQTTLSAA